VSNILKTRVAKLKKILKQSHEKSALLLGSAPIKIKSRDITYPYRQDSDFFYFTNSHLQDSCLLIISERPRPILFAKPENKLKIVWEGKGISAQGVARKISADLIVSENIEKEVRDKLKGIETLYHSNAANTAPWRVVSRLTPLAAHMRGPYPKLYGHSCVVMERLRLYKDKEEVQAIKNAIAITAQGLEQIAPLINRGKLESEIKTRLDSEFALRGCDNSFDTICASGASAATLHYQTHNKRLKEGELLLVDCGAEHNLYAADVTRMFRVGSKTKPVLEELYEIVLEAQLAALKKIRHGVKIKSVYDSAAKILTAGLVELRVLRGKNAQTFFKGQAFKPYFPHGIGHSLGLDVHDIGGHRGNNDARLEKGMVFTIEPGLYFPKKAGRVPPCGIRIEDDVLVTASGCQVLTRGLSKKL